jgi:hypothetical protein
MSANTKEFAPPIVRCRNGKLAKLDTEPHYNEFNDAWLVVYENDQIRFSLFWPSMTYYSDKRAHGLDVSGAPAGDWTGSLELFVDTWEMG